MRLPGDLKWTCPDIADIEDTINKIFLMEIKGKPWKKSQKHATIEQAPRLLNNRVRTIKCTNPDCFRMFAEMSEMNRHVREDHQGAKPNTEGMHVCPYYKKIYIIIKIMSAQL